MRSRKYKYLFQLMYTSIILVVVPALLFYEVVWKKSFQEINKLNAEYYSHSLTTFMASFIESISDFKSQVVVFSVNSRSSKEEYDVFYEGTSKMEEFAYYYGEAASDLKTYGQKIGYDNMGVYYYEKDFLLSNNVKYSFDRYLVDGLHTEEDSKNLLKHYFSKDQYQYGKVMLIPLYDEEAKSEILLLGVCTMLGKVKEEAIIFCLLDYDDVAPSYFSLSEKTRVKYYVVDNDTQKVLFSVGAKEEDYKQLQNTLEKGILNNSGVTEIDLKENPYFVVKNGSMNITFIADVTGDEVQSNIISFYQGIKFFFFYIILAALAICFAIIYFNYRPMHGLLRKIKYEGKNEFETILNAWEGQRDMLEQQRMMIMDLLINHMIYGVPISQKYINNLGVGDRFASYCVYILEKYVLKVSEMEEVIRVAEESFQTLLFATDLTGEKATVFIAFMENNNAIEFKTWLESWGNKNITEEHRLKMGQVVSEINDIQKSFIVCRIDEKEELQRVKANQIETKTVLGEVRSRTVINEKLKEKVLDYLDVNFTSCELSQQQLADHFQISVYTLSKMFNNQIGIGFSEYINGKRIEYAKELLGTTDIPIKKIAEMIGIQNDNYFSKIFKKYTGLSPIAFREKALDL